MDLNKNQNYTEKEIDDCISVITHLVNNSGDFAALPREKQIALMKIAGQLSRPDCNEIKERNKAARKLKRQQAVAKEKKSKSCNRDSFSQER